jgi:hypothetical protein
MQWNDLPNAGFSKAPTEVLYLPVIDQGPGHYLVNNVQIATQTPNSWLQHNRRANKLLQKEPLLGVGEIQALEMGHHQWFGVVRWSTGYPRILIGVFNLGTEAALVRATLPGWLGDYRNHEVMDLFSGRRLGRLDGLTLQIALPPMEYFALAINRR